MNIAICLRSFFSSKTVTNYFKIRYNDLFLFFSLNKQNLKKTKRFINSRSNTIFFNIDTGIIFIILVDPNKAK